MKRHIIIWMMILNMGSIYSQTSRSAEEAMGLQVGTMAPEFSATEAGGGTFSLKSALKEGPVVLIFYRGHWCPVCNKHLEQIQDSLKLITGMGATLVAISPQKPEYLRKMEEQTEAEFRLLYDEGYVIADAYDVTFTPDKKQLFMYNTVLNAKLKETHSDGSQRLPIPATYLVDRGGRIAWRQFDPDYKNHSNVADILEALRALSW